jgi:hypothetical protein
LTPANNEAWDVRYYETPDGRSPLLDFVLGLPPKHQAKVRQVIERLAIFGPRLGFPDTSDVSGTPFRELRTRFAGQQYRLLYVRDADAFIVFVGFHKTNDRDLDRAVRSAQKYLNDYQSE